MPQDLARGVAVGLRRAVIVFCWVVGLVLLGLVRLCWVGDTGHLGDGRAVASPTTGRGGLVCNVNAAVSRPSTTSRQAARNASMWLTSCSSSSGMVCRASWWASSGAHEKKILLRALADMASWVSRGIWARVWCAS